MRKVRVTWTETNNGLAKAEIERSDTGDTSNPVWAVIATVLEGITEYVDTVSDNEIGIVYLYKVRNKIGDLYGEYSNPASVFVEPIVVVHTPSGLSVILLPLGS